MIGQPRKSPPQKRCNSAMKVYNLQCQASHTFEGWFASEDDFLRQQAAHMVSCPMCNNAEITRMPSAPRLNLGAGQTNEASHLPTAAQLQAAYSQVVRKVLAETEDVGTRFAEEVRAMHYDQAPARNVRGEASEEEREELADEGIEVFAMPIPKHLNEPLQ